MTPEQRAQKLVSMDEKDHCTMRIGGFAMKFGDSSKMNEKQASVLIERVRRSIAEEIADALEEAASGVVEEAPAAEEKPAEPPVAESAAPEAAPAEPAEAVPAAALGETVAAVSAQLDPGGANAELIEGVVSSAYQQGVSDMRAQAKAALENLFPNLDGSMRIELNEVRQAIVERLQAMEVGQDVPKAAA